ncbi:putative two-component system sensor protein, partial [Trichinella spiralis]|uniref:putative two-component system sensor protein n=1 Tax=Trichinella spiralis TaxID=6334 RepID=UPI0001EFE2BC
ALSRLGQYALTSLLNRVEHGQRNQISIWRSIAAHKLEYGEGNGGNGICIQIVKTCRSTGIQMPDNPKIFEQAGRNDSVEMIFKRIADKCDRDGMKCDLVKRNGVAISLIGGSNFVSFRTH